MWKMKTRILVVDIIAIIFMILFLYTGISKLMEYQIFREQIAESALLAPFSTVLAIALPATEILVALALLIPRTRLVSLYVSLILMAMFTIYIGLLLLFRSNLPCSCGGIMAELSWPQHLVLNILFIVLATIGITQERKLLQESQATIIQPLNQ